MQYYLIMPYGEKSLQNEGMETTVTTACHVQKKEAEEILL